MPDMITAIEVTKSKAGSKNKPKSPEFISFLLLIGNSSYFK